VADLTNLELEETYRLFERGNQYLDSGLSFPTREPQNDLLVRQGSPALRN
jgi:hypothetical protein